MVCSDEKNFQCKRDLLKVGNKFTQGASETPVWKGGSHTVVRNWEESWGTKTSKDDPGETHMSEE